MCASQEAKPDVVQTALYFPTYLYSIEKPEFIDAVSKVSEAALFDVKKEKTFNDIYPAYMTGNIFDELEIIPFQHYVGSTAYNLLKSQGYNLSGFEPYFSEMWCQEHYKHSAMEQHVHGAGSQMVGFYFLDCPENCSRAVFHDPRSGKTQINWTEDEVSNVTAASIAVNIVPKPGLLIFTNAWLPHSFTRHGADEPMRFIHFNIGLRPAINRSANVCVAPAAEII
jgi:hypothetical protein